MFKKGDIILVPFPFTDLSSDKLRPALIISADNKTSQDVVVAFISSQMHTSQAKICVPIKENDKDFEKTGLRISSHIRLNKLATLDKKIALGELGKLSKRHLAQVDVCLKKTFGLK